MVTLRKPTNRGERRARAHLLDRERRAQANAERRYRHANGWA